MRNRSKVLKKFKKMLNQINKTHYVYLIFPLKNIEGKIPIKILEKYIDENNSIEICLPTANDIYSNWLNIDNPHL